MKVELQNLQGHFKQFHIEIPADVVARHSENYFRDLAKDVELKGFRKGKAPVTMVKQLYKESAMGRIAQQLVEEHLRKALQEHALSPVGSPEITLENYSLEAPLKFTAKFEAAPPVDLKKYTGFKAEKKDAPVADNEIETVIKNLQGQLGQFEAAPESAKVETGIFVQIDFDASEVGQAFPAASDKDVFVQIGNNELVPEFEKNIHGMKVGEVKTFTVTFPKAEKEEDALPVSGKTLDFTCTLKGLRTKILPEVNDAMAQRLGPFESLAALKTRIAEDLKNQKLEQARRENQEKAVDWLIKENPVDAPETLVNSQMEQLAIDAGMQLSKMGLNEAAIEERLKGWGGEMSERAVRQVKASMLLSAVAKKESIQVSDDELRQEIAKIASQSQRKPKDVWEDLQKRGLVLGLVGQIRELKALDWIIANATA